MRTLPYGIKVDVNRKVNWLNEKEGINNAKLSNNEKDILTVCTNYQQSWWLAYV
jgi:hypothetical protein